MAVMSSVTADASRRTTPGKAGVRMRRMAPAPRQPPTYQVEFTPQEAGRTGWLRSTTTPLADLAELGVAPSRAQELVARADALLLPHGPGDWIDA